jgi:hypothetical protein
MQEWTIFITNCPPELLTWKEVVILYRARWQVEVYEPEYTSSAGLYQLTA